MPAACRLIERELSRRRRLAIAKRGAWGGFRFYFTQLPPPPTQARVRQATVSTAKRIEGGIKKI